MSSTATESQERSHDVLARPLGQLHDFPFDVRWEVTRRHPYYQILWRDALRYRQNEPCDEAQRLLRYAAMLMVGSIGVTGEPVDPATPFEQLIERDIDPAFLTSSVQPMTLRSIVALLISALPDAERLAIGNLLLFSEDRAPNTGAGLQVEGVRAILAGLAQIQSAALDSIPETPLFYVHLEASLRTISKDIEEQAQHWKRRRNVPERRIHTAKLQDYLEVWDMREGWTDGGYSLDLESRFRDVAMKLTRSLSTVSNQYRAAFEMITGHPFSPPLWWRLFGPLKYSRLIGNAAEFASAPIRHRLDAVARARSTSATSLAFRSNRPGATAISASFEARSRTDLFLDLQDLIGRGWTNEKIAEELNLDISLIGEIRDQVAKLSELG